MVLEEEVRQKLAAYVSNRIALEDFEDWLVQKSWNMHQDSGPGAMDLVLAIELSLSEYTNDHMDESQLRRELSELLDNAAVGLRIRVNADIIVSFEQPSQSASNSLRVEPPEPLIVLAQA